MTEQKNGEPSRVESPGVPKRTAQASGEPSPVPKETRNGKVASGATATGLNARSKHQFLIGFRPLPGASASLNGTLHETLEQMEDIEILRRLHPKGFKGLGAGALPGVQEIIVVRMDEQRAEALRQGAPPHVVVERDARLGVGQAMLPMSVTMPWPSRMVAAPRRRQDIRFAILGIDDQPLPGAGITVFGQGFEAQAITDSSGMASVAIFNAEADLEQIQAIYVQPAADHWEYFVQYPQLDPAETTVVRLNPLFPAAAKPVDEKWAGWGQKAMNLDHLATGQTGAGVKIALIDSGCDNSHPLLRHVTQGVNLTSDGGAKDWTRDEIGQGTHCAGIIAGVKEASRGIAGIAPGAEIHVFKISPGGHLGDLIVALDQCIERQIDIVHLGVGCHQLSELVAKKMIEARFKGIACIAAAGDEAGPAQFPSVVPGVLSVSAVGRLGEFPWDTHHGLTAIPELIGPAGVFATNFSGVGPQIGVCGPGVAVVSSVPGGGFAARDGTAVAAAHVTGFAALVLAHHSLFQSSYRSRGEQRVNALFDLIRSSAASPVFDPARVGVGLPDLQRVPGMGMSDIDVWNSAAVKNFNVFAGMAEGFGDRLPPNGVPPAYLSGTLALMQQLRAAGLI